MLGDRLVASLLPLAIALLAPLLTACEGDYRATAVGDTGQLIVVMDSSHWQGEVGTAVRDVLEAPVLTLPVAEPAFAVEFTDISSIKQFESRIRNRKYVLFAGLLDADNNVSRFLRARLDSTVQARVRSGDPGVFLLRDVWFREQIIYYVTASSDSALVRVLLENGETIRYNLNEANRSQMEAEMFARMRQDDIEDDLMDRHGFAVNVQHDYLVATDTTSFFWMRRFVDAQNWRSFFIYYVDRADPSVLSPSWILDTRNRITETYITGNFGDFVRVDERRPLESPEINFLDRYGFETRGLWHLVGYDQQGDLRSAGGGGPFLNYTFYDEEQGRIYMLDGMIFAPKYDKRELLRQIEVIAHTFRTRPEMIRQEAEAIATNP